jgi:hypothetical protein
MLVSVAERTPLKRNHHIVDAADQLIAFWDEKSKGTKYTIDLARKKTYQSS